MTSLCMCPHCGYDLRNAEPVKDGPFSYDPGQGVFYKGRRINLTRQAHILLGSLMLAKGRFVSVDTLAQRMDSDASDPGRLISVYLFRARRAVPTALPVEFIHGFGLRWSGVAQ